MTSLRRAAVPHAYEVLVGRRHSGFERDLHRHHDAPDPAPHRHGLRRGLVRQAVHGRDLPFHVRPDALADGAGLVPVCGCRALRLPDPAGVCEVCHPLRRHSAGGARRRRAEAGMNAPILSFFAAHAPRQALHRGRRRRFFRCPACRAVQIVPAGCGQTKIVCRKCGEIFLRRT